MNLENNGKSHDIEILKKKFDGITQDVYVSNEQYLKRKHEPGSDLNAIHESERSELKDLLFENRELLQKVGLTIILSAQRFVVKDEIEDGEDGTVAEDASDDGFYIYEDVWDDEPVNLGDTPTDQYFRMIYDAEASFHFSIEDPKKFCRFLKENRVSFSGEEFKRLEHLFFDIINEAILSEDGALKYDIYSINTKSAVPDITKVLIEDYASTNTVNYHTIMSTFERLSNAQKEKSFSQIRITEEPFLRFYHNRQEIYKKQFIESYKSVTSESSLSMLPLEKIMKNIDSKILRSNDRAITRAINASFYTPQTIFSSLELMVRLRTVIAGVVEAVKDVVTFEEYQKEFLITLNEQRNNLLHKLDELKNKEKIYDYLLDQGTDGLMALREMDECISELKDIDTSF